MAMIRKQVYIEQAQDETLKRLAASLGVSEAEVIRMAIENLSSSTSYVAGASEQVRMMRETAVLYRTNTDSVDQSRSSDLDRQAWLKLLASMKERAATSARADGGRDWTRDELYDERPKYLSR